MGTTAMPPADVAAMVAYAIKANQFWILSHQSTRSKMMARNRRLEQGLNPVFGDGA